MASLAQKYGLPESPLINKALDLAIVSHRHEKRQSNNEPYVMHPIRVGKTVYLLSEFKDNMRDIASAILHDTIENCGLKKAVFLNTFGYEDGTVIYENVDALTLPEEASHGDLKIIWQLNHMPVMTQAQQSIKLADRKDNVETLPKRWINQRKLEYIIHSQNLLAASTKEVRVSSLGLECGQVLQEHLLKYSPSADKAKAYARKKNTLFFFRRVAALSL